MNAKLRYTLFLFIALIVLSCESDEKPELGTPEQSVSLIQWKGTNSKAIHQVGDTLIFAYKVGDPDALDGDVEMYWNDSLISTTNEGDVSIRFATGDKDLGIQHFRLVAKRTDGKKLIKNFNYEMYSDIVAGFYDIRVVGKLPHSRDHFTQGLEFHNGRLFEGTGQKGESFIAEIDMNSGEPKRKFELDDRYFGEGITILDNKLYQLTYKAHKCFVYDLETFDKIQEFDYSFEEGWGLTNNGHELILSNGSNILYFLDPTDFTVKRELPVYFEDGEVGNLNELEYVEGEIYANIFTEDAIARIDPNTGKVLSFIIINKLRNEVTYNPDMDVLNGIAYDKRTKKLYVTGKKWPNLFEIELTEVEPVN